MVPVAKFWVPGSRPILNDKVSENKFSLDWDYGLLDHTITLEFFLETKSTTENDLQCLET